MKSKRMKKKYKDEKNYTHEKFTNEKKDANGNYTN